MPVTGRVDHDLLDPLTHQLTTTPWPQQPASDPDPDRDGDGPGRDTVRATVKDLILANAVALLSGPG